MKKLITFIAVCFLFIGSVKANTIKTSIELPDNVEKNEIVPMTVSVTGENVWGVIMKLNYDTTRFQLIESEGLSTYTATVGKNIVLDTETPQNGTFKVANLKFKALKSGPTTMSLTNVEGSTDGALVPGTNVSESIKVEYAPGEEPVYKAGDVTMDGKVDLVDVMYALRISLRLVTNVSDEVIKIGDINGVDGIDLADVMYILRIALNLA